jgi:hypothetical protein
VVAGPLGAQVGREDPDPSVGSADVAPVLGADVVPGGEVAGGEVAGGAVVVD